jgi:hypothetical protein
MTHMGDVGTGIAPEVSSISFERLLHQVAAKEPDARPCPPSVRHSADALLRSVMIRGRRLAPLLEALNE